MNILKADLNLLKTLDVLLDEGSVSRSAERLHVTQPSVSNTLARLRELFDDPLFIRTQRGLIPTAKAESLQPQIKRLLSDADRLLNPVSFEPETAAFTFTITANDHVQNSLLVSFIDAVRKRAPHIRIALLPMMADGLVKKMAQGDIDLAVTFPELLPRGLINCELYGDSYVGVVRKQHPVKARKISLKQFCEYQHVIISPPTKTFWGPADDALAALGVRRNVVLSVPSFSILPGLLETSDLIAIVPKRFLETTQHDLRMVSLPFAIPGFSVVSAWHQRADSDAAQRWLRELLLSVVGSRD